MKTPHKPGKQENKSFSVLQQRKIVLKTSTKPGNEKLDLGIGPGGKLFDQLFRVNPCEYSDIQNL